MISWRDTIRFDARAALLPMAGMALLLFGGALSGMETALSIAAGAAFSVGFGATRRLFDRRWTAMLLTVAGMTLAAFAGTLVGQLPMLELIGTALAGATCGMLALRDGNLWWVSVQVIIAFLVTAHYPGDVGQAWRRATLVAAGGLLQFGLVVGAMRAFGVPDAIVAMPAVPDDAGDTAWHALRAALCMTAALASGNAIGLANSYWAPMTAMLVLKPGLRNTGLRGLERVVGTVGGIALATVLASVLLGSAMLLACIATLATAAAFGLQQARYALLSGMITLSVVLMTVLAGAQVLAVDKHRLAATLLGGTIALAGAGIAPRRAKWHRTAQDRP